jgi:hypothetical protein
MRSTYQAVVVTAPGKLELIEREIPIPEAGEAQRPGPADLDQQGLHQA